MTVERALLGTTDSNAASYIEDVFSTYLYTGTGAAQTITNGIDLSTKGGMVWLKSRSAATDNALYDTSRGATYDLVSNSTAAQTTQVQGLTSFGTTGFSVGTLAKINTSAATYASWAFRKQANFFDVVTYTGSGTARTIAHNLGSVPGCIIVKCTSTTGNWAVYHRSQTSASYYTKLNLTDSESSATTIWNGTAPTGSVFSVGTSSTTNANGATYVAYLFAHDAGGFGVAGTDNVISCGSFTTDGLGNATVSLGYEAQFVIYKAISVSTDWFASDVMRGMSITRLGYLIPNSSTTETSGAASPGPGANYLEPTATGFKAVGLSTSAKHIYIAIRRGPMKTPTGANCRCLHGSATDGDIDVFRRGA